MYVYSIVIMRTFLFYTEKDHNYMGVNHSYSCDDSSTHIDLTMSDIDFLEQSVKRLNDSDKRMRDLFIEKITKDDSSIQQYTGFPSKKIFAVHLVSMPQLNIYWKYQMLYLLKTIFSSPLTLCPKYN